MLRLSAPQIIEREPYCVVGVYCPYEGEDEGPGWAGADSEFNRRRAEIPNRKGDAVLGFLYRPHKDYPDVSEAVRACFVGVEVADLDHVPAGMAATRFSGGQYVVIACTGDVEAEAAEGVGEAIGLLNMWMAEQGYVEGDACFACGHENVPRPPFVEYVYIKIERRAG